MSTQSKGAEPPSGLVRLKTLVSDATNVNGMVEFDPFNLEQVGDIESDDILTSDMNSVSNSDKSEKENPKEEEKKGFEDTAAKTVINETPEQAGIFSPAANLLQRVQTGLKSTLSGNPSIRL